MHRNAAFNSLLFLLLSVMVLFQFGCPHRDDDPIVPVPTAITADFSASPMTGYVPLAVHFTDESTSTSGITSWSWDFGDGGTSTSQNPDHTYSGTGSFTVTLTVAGPDGSDTQAKAAYIVVSVSGRPVANFTADVTTGDAPLTVQFTDTSAGIYDTWSWDFNEDGVVDSSDQNPSYIYTQAGTYDVTLAVDGPDGDDMITKTGFIVVTEPSTITADFTASPATGNAPLTVSFTDASTGSVTSWAWDFGDGGSSTSQNPNHTYNSAGSFTVTLAVAGPDGSDTQAKAACIVVSTSGPVADFTADVTSGDAPLTVQFTDTSAGLCDIWLWDFNEDGTVDSVDQNPSYTYTQAGTYDVTLAVDGPDGDDMITRTGFIVVTEPSTITADFTASPATGNAPLTVSFSDASTGTVTAWAWDFDNDGTFDSTTQNPTHIYTLDGIYTVTLTVTGPGGFDQEVKTNYITAGAPPPVADFTADVTAGDAPLTVNFTNLSGGNITAWAWDFDDDGTWDSTEQNPSHTYNTAGTYTVNLTVTGPSGSDQEIKSNYITAVEPAAVADFTATPTSGDAPLAVDFTDTSTSMVTSWLWEFGVSSAWSYRKPITITNSGAELTDYQVKIDVTYDADMQGDFDDLRFTASDGTTPLPYWVEKYTDSTSATVWVKVPTIAASGDTTIYMYYGEAGAASASDGDAVFELFDPFNGTSVDTDKWTVSGSDFSVAGGELKFTNTNSYLHSITTFNSGNQIRAKFRTVTNPTQGYMSAMFHAADGNGWGVLTYPPSPDYVLNDSSWPPMATAAPYTTDLLVLVGVDETNSANATVKNYSTGADYWTYNATNDVGNEFVRLGQRPNGFAGQAGEAYWDWIFVCKYASNDPTVAVGAEEAGGLSATSTEQNPSFLYTAVGTYTVTLTVDGPDGSDQEIKTNYITVNEPAPVADFTADVTAGDAPLTVNFTDLSGGNITAWTWDFDNDGTWDSTEQNPGHTYNTAGTYTVVLTVTGLAGSYTQTKTNYITVSTPGGNTIYVDGTSGNDTDDGLSWAAAVKTIQTGLDKANDNWTVIVADGTYTGTSNKNLDFTGKAIHLKSAAGAASCIIDCENDGRGFFFHSGETGEAIVEGFTVQGGKVVGTSGGGIRCENSSSPTIRNCTIKDCTAERADNSGGAGGGILCLDSGAIVTTCVITNNIAYTVGAGICLADSTGTVSGCTIEYNQVTYWNDGGGGGIYCLRSSATISTCTISNNQAGVTFGRGGGVYLNDCDNLLLSNCVITDNSATYDGGGIHCYSGFYSTITDCTISGNSTNEYGGGISCHSCYHDTIANCSINNNSTVNRGGGIHCYSGSYYLITNCTMSNNWAESSGGGIYYSITNVYPSTISNCYLTANTSYRGGGIYCYGHHYLDMVNCVIVGNTAPAGYPTACGGGIYLFSNCSPTLTNCTIAFNQTRESGGGIYCTGGSTPTLNNTIIWGNTTSSNVGCQIGTYQSDCIVTVYYCDYANASKDIGGGGTVTDPDNTCIHLDPLFVGGSPFDYRLQTGSPCIDVGDKSLIPTGVPTDLDGNPRIVNGIVDLGAYEKQ